MKRAATLPRGLLVAALTALLLAGCATQKTPPAEPRDGPPRQSPGDLSQVPDAVPRDEPRSRYGNPASYEVFGQRYYVMDAVEVGFVQRGIASWYGSKFHGRRTSSGEPYDMYAMTAAHKELPLPSYVEVTNLRNGRKAVVKVNDRGPFKAGRIIDLSYAAATRLDIVAAGTAPVEIRVVGPDGGSAKLQPVNLASVSEAKIAYYIQAGAFSDRSNADRLRGRLTGLGVPVEVSSAELAMGRLHRVRLGPVADVASLDRLIDSLAEAGIRDTQVVIAD